MGKTDIWVEGTADQKFLADVLEQWFSIQFDMRFECRDELGNILIRLRKGDGVSSFISEAGWENTKPNFEGEDRGFQNLIIIDADENFDKRIKEIVQTIIGVNFDPENQLFLIPDHRNNGNLETLLEQIINPEHSILFECWNAYETCLRSKEEKEYTLPPQKAKIYAYLEALLNQNEKKKINPVERDYSNKEHWNLDHTKEPLKPLYEFLKKHLKER